MHARGWWWLVADGDAGPAPGAIAGSAGSVSSLLGLHFTLRINDSFS